MCSNRLPFSKRISFYIQGENRKIERHWPFISTKKLSKISIIFACPFLMARTIVPCFCLKMKMYDFPIVQEK